MIRSKLHLQTLLESAAEHFLKTNLTMKTYTLSLNIFCCVLKESILATKTHGYKNDYHFNPIGQVRGKNKNHTEISGKFNDKTPTVWRIR